MRIFGGEQVSKMMEFLRIPEDQPIEHSMVSKAIEQAQVKVEGFNFDRRKQVVEYDDVMNKQREIIYAKRNQILESGTEETKLKEEIKEKLQKAIENLVNLYTPENVSLGEQVEIDQLVGNFCEIIPFDDRSISELKKRVKEMKSASEITEFLIKIVFDTYEQKEKRVTAPMMRQLEKFVYLSSSDRLWINHLDAMEDLREGVGLRGMNDEERIVLYKKDGYEMFERLMQSIDNEVIHQIYRAEFIQAPTVPQDVVTNADQIDQMGLADQSKSGGKPIKPVVSGQRKLGRNDPCWCGSGKKWKRCHYPQLG
jgi:preprotein translocase subunit SecA